MTKMKGLAACIAASLISSVAIADTWEPGLGVSASYAFMNEMKGSSGNSMDGRQHSVGLRYSTPDPVPVSVGITYKEGSSDHSGDSLYSSASANTRIVNADVLIGKVFTPGKLEFVPYTGLGFRRMSQHMSSQSYPDNNDIATPGRSHRHLYIPAGLYLGGSQPIDSFDFYLSAEYRQVVMGEASLSRNGGSHMRSNTGYGVRTEMGVHFPSSLSYNLYAGVYYDHWDIGSADKGISGSGSSVRVEREPRTSRSVAGISLGLRF